VACVFGVSERLVWNWIASGVLSKYRPPSKNHRKGIAASAIQAFLRDLEQCASFGVELTRERKQPAWERGKEEAEKLREDEELTPAQFAARSGVSVATVYRLVADNVLHSERPTDHRIKICHWRRKYRKKMLTGKKSRKGH
jgi:transcriptional regulator with XRE-family HTH domain